MPTIRALCNDRRHCGELVNAKKLGPLHLADMLLARFRLIKVFVIHCLRIHELYIVMIVAKAIIHLGPSGIIVAYKNISHN